MGWLDSPPCGQQVCVGANAGSAVIRNVTVGVLPPPEQHMWVVSDSGDELYKQIVPTAITEDPKLFVSKGVRGIAEWRDGMHFAKQQVCGSDGQPCPQQMADMGMIMRRDGVLPQESSLAWGLTSGILALVVFAGLATLVGLVRGVRSRRRHSAMPLLSRSDSGLACEMAMLEAAVEDGASDSDNME